MKHWPAATFICQLFSLSSITLRLLILNINCSLLSIYLSIYLCLYVHIYLSIYLSHVVSIYHNIFIFFYSFHLFFLVCFEQRLHECITFFPRVFHSNLYLQTCSQTQAKVERERDRERDRDRERETDREMQICIYMERHT